MGFVLSLLKTRPDVELRIKHRDLNTFLLFPNIEVSYKLNLKQDYTNGVEKVDTNSWEVDLSKEMNNFKKQFFEEIAAKKTKVKIEEEKVPYTQQVNLAENLEEEAQQKQLRKMQAKINGLKNRIQEREKVIEKQRNLLQTLKVKKDKIEFECNVVRQMVKKENEEFELYRNYDFSYVSKSYKLADISKGLKRKKKGKAINTINPTQKITTSSLPKDSNFSSFKAPIQNAQIAAIKQNKDRRGSALLSFMQSDSGSTYAHQSVAKSAFKSQNN